MALILGSQDIARIETVQGVLLSPLEYQDAQAWCCAVVEVTGTLFRSDRVLFNIGHDGRVVSAWGAGFEGFEQVLHDIVAGAEPGAIRYDNDQLDGAMQLQRGSSLEVWSNRMIERLHGVPMDRMPFYWEFMEPAGTVEGGGMTISLPAGEAMIGANPGPPGHNPFGEDWLELFRLILPAFKAGAHMLVSLETRRDALAAALDEMAHAAAVWSLDGRELHRSRAYRELLEGEPESERVELGARRLMERLSALRRPRGKTGVDAPIRLDTLELATLTTRYQLRGAFLPAGAIDRDAAMLITVVRPTPAVPTTVELRERFALTPREAEVARLLALGLSNAAVAERLFISPHTVRSHGERIFRKVGVHTRTALSVRVLGSDSG